MIAEEQDKQLKEQMLAEEQSKKLIEEMLAEEQDQDLGLEMQEEPAIDSTKLPIQKGLQFMSSLHIEQWVTPKKSNLGVFMVKPCLKESGQERSISLVKDTVAL